jgi:ABC-type branched-subunit amino acid transport system substrate-binding protein
MRTRGIRSSVALGLALALWALRPEAALAQCTITIGVVMSLTGPAGQFGQAGSKAVELAFRDLNEAGGVAGCRLAADIRDAQSQGSVAVDAAKQLVEIKRVPAIIGGIISSVSIPILTSVTAPAGVVQISPASSSPTLTQLGREGKSGGWFFRTITTDALQGVAAARYALDTGFRRLSVIHVNNDFGVNMVREFSRAYGALGGTIISVTPYNPSQASYQPEVTRAMQGAPDALYLVSYPVDGATIARQWISLGGVKKFLLNDGMNSAKFIQDVGAQHLEDAYGTSSGTTRTPSTEYFAREYPPFAKFDAGAPAADRSYDAAAILGLAIAHAGRAEPAAVRDSVRKVLDPQGAAIHAGPAEFRKALALLRERKPIRYVGVIGPVQFDRYGDITGPFRLWRIQGGEVRTTGEMSAADVDRLKAQLPDCGPWCGCPGARPRTVTARQGPPPRSPRRGGRRRAGPGAGCRAARARGSSARERHAVEGCSDPRPRHGTRARRARGRAAREPGGDRAAGARGGRDGDALGGAGWLRPGRPRGGPRPRLGDDRRRARWRRGPR